MEVSWEGQSNAKRLSALIMVLLWVIYVVMSTLQSQDQLMSICKIIILLIMVKNM